MKITLFILIASIHDALGADITSSDLGMLDAGVLNQILGMSEERFIQQLEVDGLNLMPQGNALDDIEKHILELARSREIKLTAKQGPTDASNATAAADGDLSVFLGQVLQILDSVMKVNILQRVGVTQSSIDAKLAGFQNCTHPNATIAAVNLETLSGAHRTCRNTQNATWTSWDKYCGSGAPHPDEAIACQPYEDAKSTGINIARSPDSTCIMAPGTAIPTMGTYLRSMERFFQGRLDDIEMKKRRCQHSKNTTTATAWCHNEWCTFSRESVDCGDKQAVFEEAACTLFKDARCSTYTSCYNRTSSLYSQAIAEARASEAVYKAEWRSILRIRCLVKALNATDAQITAEIDTCKAASHATTEVEINLSSAPPEQPCTDSSDLEPGKPQFNSKWYAGLPDNALALSCASTCCGGRSVVGGVPANCPLTLQCRSEDE
eukprot:TRINITY_DN92555_c0_g1_i1.p1 TRINITY_DN92555_c0_g1~~TRINITY_DN92555_c0_g1_i1.p1  ORF type:complete len:436 (+),score=66.96 TRINITY_DN92555_c0_g1_i1:87-1394(+)